MACNYQLTTNSIGNEICKRLEQLFGSNLTMIELVKTTAIVNDNDFTDSFKEYLKNVKGIKQEITLDNIKDIIGIKKVTDYMIEYYKKDHPDGHDTIINAQNVNDASASYGGASNRAFCIARMVDSVNTIFRKHRYEEKDYKKHNKDFYIDEVIETEFGVLVNRVLGKKLTHEKYEEYKEKGLLNYVRALRNKTDNEQNKVLAATLTEMLINRDEFFNKVFESQALQYITKEISNDESDDSVDDLDTHEQNIAEGKDNEETYDFTTDITIGMYDHSGQYGTFTTHIGGTLNGYLSSLRKCKSYLKDESGNYIYDTDNCIGIPECFTSQEIAQILYNRSYNNVEDFKKQVEDIAKTIPGYEGLIQFYDDMTKNPNLAEEAFSTFNKYRTAKQEIFISGNEVQIRATNQAGSRESKLLNRYFNAARANARRVDYNYVNNILIPRLEQSINNSGKLSTAKQAEIVKDLYSALHQFIPEITETTIVNFIDRSKNNGVLKKKDNIRRLFNYIKRLSDDYKNIANEIHRINTELYKLNLEVEKANKERINGSSKSNNFKERKDELLAIDPVNGNNNNNLIELAKALLPYTLIKDDLNTRNAEGNISSDVINNSRISYLKSILTSELNSNLNDESAPINRFRDYIFKDKQYNFSTILVEQQEDGNIIIPGLFRLEHGKYVPTDYFDELIQFNLFGGVLDSDNNKTSLFANATETDYFISGFLSYLNSKPSAPKAKQHGIVLGTYMMRTPSDSPKQSTFTAPRYDTTGFRTVKDEVLENAINSIPSKQIVDIKEPMKLGADLFTDIVSGTVNKLNILNTNKLTIQNNNIVDFAITEGTTTIYCTGTLSENKKEINDIRVTFAKQDIDGTVRYTDEVKQAIKNKIKQNYIKANSSYVSIDRTSPMFKAFQLQFRSEMQEALIATKVMFKYNSARKIELNPDGTPILIINKDKLSENYHTKGNVTKKEGTTIKLTGNVFHSNKFILVRNGEVVNYMDEVLSEDAVIEETDDASKINILYGGAGNLASALHEDENGNVYFTPAQQETIDNAIEKFLLDYIDDSLKRVQKYDKTLNELEINNSEKIIDCILNYTIAYYAADDLFEGSVKFYKNVQDFFKRAKESQAGGVPNAFMDLTRPINDEKERQLIETSALNSKEIQEILDKAGAKAGKSKGWCKQYTTFKAVTVENTERTNKAKVEELRKSLTNSFKQDKNLSDKEIKKRVEDILKGFHNITVNDAQSYITFEEWIRRVSARGQLYKYLPLIERILDESKPLRSEDIKEFIQVQKNFYYDMAYDEVTRVIGPRQIKNAEFVLVPRLIKGTELEQVYNAMIEGDIDQINTVETSKAGKSRILTLWDQEGNLTGKNLANFKKEIAKKDVASRMYQIFDYNFLYTQQETPQHLGINTENKFGLQISKKVLDNIPENHPLHKHKENIINAVCTNIKQSWEDLLTDFGIDVKDGNINFEVDDKGNAIISGYNKEGVLNKLKQEFIRTGIDSNLADYITPVEGSTDLSTVMPLYANNSTITKVENVIQAVFNRSVTRQKLPGFHAAQITRVGFKDFVDSNEEQQYPSELRMRPNNEGYIEVMLPYSAFDIDPNDKKYKGLSKLERDKKILEELEKDGKDKTIAKVVGYRIPTEGKMSSQVMKVVGFIPSEYGSTIVVPDEWVGLTGSDFDIDSVYGIQYKTEKDENGNIRKVKYFEDLEDAFINYVYEHSTKSEREKIYKESGLEDSSESLEHYLKYKDYRFKTALLDVAKTIAKDKGFKTLDTLTEKDIIWLNSRDARNNFILDNIINILESSESIQEMLSQSQFRHITSKTGDGAVEHMLGTKSEAAVQRQNRSPYNFLDQVENFEDASAGRALKGFSVSCDTFVSICNTVRPELNGEGIPIVYHYDTLSNSDFEKKIKELRNRFGENNIKEDTNTKSIIVYHNKYGWSNDNKNIDGYFITLYTAETTAHILDAIKEGAVPNVNVDTFSVYKTLPSLGIDFDTTIGFMMQPAITRLVREINSTKSVFSNTFSKPIELIKEQLISQLAASMNVSKEEAILYADKAIKNLYVLDFKELKKRFDKGNAGLTNEDILFDYAVINQYEKLHSMASKITALTMVCNPDKFGAKQTIYATQKVFDDIARIQERERLNPADAVFKGDFLEKIYPDIHLGVTEYLKSTNNNSAYPTLHHYLKYASATSIVINSMLLATHSAKYEESIRRITDVFSVNGNTTLSEELYSDFSKYIMTCLYNQINIIRRPIMWSKESGIYNEEPQQEEIDSEVYAKEQARIYGFNKPSDISYINDKGETIQFTVKDINNPTDDEIKIFATLSPAQKVKFIQDNFRDSLVCKYLTAQLYNSSKYSANIPGSQTIKFDEDATSLEQVYEEFKFTYQNENPLLALTAMDIIKYSVVVEGLKTKRNGVSKCISNKPLIESNGIMGCGFVDALKHKVNLVSEQGISSITDSVDGINSVVHNYVRGHIDMKELPHIYIKPGDKEASKHLALHKDTNIVIVKTDDLDYLQQHKFGVIAKSKDSEGNTNETFIPNNYIVINRGKKLGKTLYRIYEGNNGLLYLIPLNPLNPNETFNSSADITNNIYANYNTLSAIVKGWSTEEFGYNDVTERFDLTSEASKQIKEKTNATIDINSKEFEILREKITRHFDGTNEDWLLVRDIHLENYITVPAKDLSTDNGQYIKVNGRIFRLWKLDTKYTDDQGNERSVFNQYLTEQGKTKSISKKHEAFTQLIQEARDSGISSFEVYAIRPVNPEVKHSSITEGITLSNDDILRQAAQGNENAQKYVRHVNQGVISESLSQSDKLNSVIISTAEYVTSTVERLLNGKESFNYFAKDLQTGELFSMTDQRAVELLKRSAEFRRKYLKNILDAYHLIDTYKSFKDYKFDDPNAQHYIDKIVEAIQKLERENVAKQAEDLYIDEYLTSISIDPQVKNKLKDLHESFHKTSFINSRLNDLQETTNPLLQIITSDVMRDVRAKELQGDKRSEEFLKRISDLKKEAAKHGRNIDWKKIIDEDGRFINQYNEQFVDEITKLDDTRRELYAKYKSISNTPENKLERISTYTDYLKALRKYNEYVLQHCHQSLTEEYYDDMLSLEDTMIDKNGNYYDVYVEYKMLTDELAQILSHPSDSDTDSVWENKRKELSQRLRNLRSNAIRDAFGNYEFKHDLTDETFTSPLEKREAIINTASSAQRLDAYIKQKTAITNKYYNQNAKFGFDELVKKNREIVERYEKRDPITKKIIRSAESLAEIEEYTKAKKWLSENTLHKYAFNAEADKMTLTEAKSILLAEYNATLSEEQAAKKVAAARRFFKVTVGERANEKSIYKDIAKTVGAYDNMGVFDARKLSDEQIASIKKEQEQRYGVSENKDYSETRIMHTSTKDDTVYTEAFWSHLKPEGVTSIEYANICKQINTILRTCLNSSTGVLETHLLDEEQLKELVKLYEKLGYDSITREFNTFEGVRKRVGSSKEKNEEIRKFIEEKCEFDLIKEDKQIFDLEELRAKAYGEDSLRYRLWCTINYEFDTKTNTFRPNHLLWGHLKPKDSLSKSELSKYIDKERTAAIRILNEAFTEHPSIYYESKEKEVREKYGQNSKEYKDWYEANHIYNPHTHSIEPLVCWMISEPNDDTGSYEPTYDMIEKEPKPGYTNAKFKKDVGNIANYKNKEDRAEIKERFNDTSNPNDPLSIKKKKNKHSVIPDSKTDRSTFSKLNPEEEKLRDYVKETLYELASNPKARKYFDKGYLPAMKKQEDIEDIKSFGKELLKGFGFIDSYGNPTWHSSVNYATDEEPEMPMLRQLTDKTITRKPSIYDKKYINNKEQYEKDLAEYEKNETEIKKKNAEIHRALLNQDWEYVLSEWIKRAAHYNAIQQNKHNLYFAQLALNHQRLYHTNYAGVGDLKRKIRQNGTVEYDTTQDKNLIEQYEHWLHKLIYGEFKENQGAFSTISRIAKAITSEQYMTINLRGGIGNVTTGSINIANEWAAAQEFDAKDYRKGISIYNGALFSYAQSAYSDKSTSLQDAIIKGMHIVDYDEFRGLENTVNAAVYMQRVRDAGYFCQTAGEHFMQNSAMFAMMVSHKLFKNPNYKEGIDNGQPEYILLNKEEYMREAEELALQSICSETEYKSYKDFIESIKTDVTKREKYNTYHKSYVSEFVKNIIPDKAKEFDKKRKELRKQYAEEFDKNENDFYSQFDLDKESGKMKFKDGSIMDKMNFKTYEVELSDGTKETRTKEVTDAYATLGRFKQRVLSVNKKIHGNYGKLDASKWDSHWLGSLFVQFHKHIVPGFMKRWRIHGYFNEERGTVEKGSYISLFEFLKAPIDDIANKSGITDGERQALKTAQYVLGNITDYVHYLKLNINTMPEYEKANIRRALADFGGMAIALILAIGVRLAWDDDDDDFLYNLLLHEADRTYSETNMWNPRGAITEFTTLYSTPFAAQSFPQDILKIFNNVADMIMQGDEYEPNFVSGRYAGQNKFWVYTKRRIPYIRNVFALTELADNNRYYKRGSSFIDTVPKAVADNIKD